mmetsp:Transcript_20394/g.52239  ORF Transcript_20394/g.52239 Transcript_20394/m.52239 type:complete len:106 (+) Transcript_20394:871-1188(+)|eukprot:CAMPEP_0113894444 /NCGR_PEP_ID=MMETSP0780_2-20120614/16725_1 /TAXON_ID=652834 /ORGANISM="Palpitomonas bilix" /LENGTH=105 /DNA_ID=CAMNT_0000884993 /DNA_START=497 /DNA_END=814 /DNA_ORIENTATION=- /assembly_acc=CAM_ASM_000599
MAVPRRSSANVLEEEYYLEVMLFNRWHKISAGTESESEDCYHIEVESCQITDPSRLNDEHTMAHHREGSLRPEINKYFKKKMASVSGFRTYDDIKKWLVTLKATM